VCEIDWVDDKKEGVFKMWDVSGEKLLVDLVWRDGKQTGFSKYDRQDEVYVDGKRDGVFRLYIFTARDDEAREAMMTAKAKAEAIGAAYFLGEMPGFYIEQEKNFKGGEPDGLHRSWHRKDQLSEETMYKSGKKIYKREWFESGELYQEAVWDLEGSGGLFYGEAGRRNYGRNGKLLSTECYSDDCTILNKILPLQDKYKDDVPKESDKGASECVDKMIAAFREENGDAFVKGDMLEEWEEECKQK